MKVMKVYEEEEEQEIEGRRWRK